MTLLKFKYRESYSECFFHRLFYFQWRYKRLFCFHFLYSLVPCFDHTNNTFGNWRCPLHLMSQQVSISSSESLNDTKLLPFHLLYGYFEIRHTLKLNFSPFLSKEQSLFISSGRKDAQCLLLYSLAFNNGFNGTNLCILRVCHSFEACVVGQSFSPLGTNTPELILYWVPTSCHKSLMDCKASALRVCFERSRQRWHIVRCNGEGCAQKHYVFTRCMYC